ncbi:unnamed protein product, partial [Heterosigma akashiwo]
NYTSPPTIEALEATPKEWRNGSLLAFARTADADGSCSSLDPRRCQILFAPLTTSSLNTSAKIGVLFYGGALVDPRSYSPIAKSLSEKYGFAVAIPVFSKDLATIGPKCQTGRVELAAAAFPGVEKWVLGGHSMGGIAAQFDLFTAVSRNQAEHIGGLFLLGSYVQEKDDVDSSCGQVDLSMFDLPAAAVTASNDRVVDRTGWEKGKKYLPANNTFYLHILGGNHSQFGSYDTSGRYAALGDYGVDGNATVPELVQRALSIDAIVHVASRMGIPLPTIIAP